VKSRLLISAICLSSLVAVIPANGASFTFSTGNPDGLMAAASRPMCLQANSRLKLPTTLF